MEKSEYSGAALNSFILGLGQSREVIDKLLADLGVESIDPERWYDFDWARSVYIRTAKEVGDATVKAIGRKMIETAEYPPGIDSVEALLPALDAAYRLNARGSDIGEIKCELEDDCSATLVWSTPFPCALNIGIMEGSCSRYGTRALIEHGPDGCMDEGAKSCTYYVSW